MDLAERTRRFQQARGKAVRVSRSPQHSSIDAGTYAGQTGRIVGAFQDTDTVLVALSLQRGVSWVDYRDLEKA